MNFDPLAQKSFDNYVYEKTKKEIEKTVEKMEVNDVNKINDVNKNINNKDESKFKPELLKNNTTKEREIENPAALSFGNNNVIIEHPIPSAGNYSRVIYQPTGEVDIIRKMRENISY